MRKLIKRIVLNVVICLFFTNGLCAQYLVSYVPKHVNSNYIFELIRDCLGKENFREIVDQHYSTSLYFFYDMNGDLKKITTGQIFDVFLYAQFLESEWEQMFDYIKNLPPMPLPNPSKYYYDGDVESVMNKINRNKGISFDGSWRNYWRYGGVEYSKEESYFEWLENSHSSYDIKDSGENPDSIFGEINWHDVRSQYFEALNSGNLKPNIPKFNMITPEDFKKEGYCWEKSPSIITL